MSLEICRADGRSKQRTQGDLPGGFRMVGDGLLGEEDEFGVFVDLDVIGVTEGVSAGEFRTKEKGLRGVVNPHEEDDKGACRAIGGGERAVGEIKTEAEFTDLKKQRRKEGAEPDVAPGDLDIGEGPKNHGKQEGDHNGGKDKGEGLVHGDAEGHVSTDEFAKGREGGADDERDEEKKSDGEHHGKGDEAVLDEMDDAEAGFAAHLPDGVEGVLQFDENGGRTHKKGDDGHDGGKRLSGWFSGARDDSLNGLASLRAQQAMELIKELLTGGLITEEKSRDGKGEHDQRRDGKHGVEGERCAEAKAFVFAPAVKGLLRE